MKKFQILINPTLSAEIEAERAEHDDAGDRVSFYVNERTVAAFYTRSIIGWHEERSHHKDH